MNKLQLGLDENLGVPSDFQDLFNLVSYKNLAKQIDDFENNKLDLIFLPAGAVLDLKGNFTILAQATLGPDFKTTLSTTLVTSKNLSISQAFKCKIGYINQYCTTSFWAPQIYFKNSNEEYHPIQFIKVDNFTELLNKTVSQEIDVAMVWDKVLEQEPNSAKKVKEFVTLTQLPSPIIVGNNYIPPNIKNEIIHFKSRDKNSFFNGFTSPDLVLINEFKKEIRLIQEKHFVEFLEAKR